MSFFISSTAVADTVSLVNGEKLNGIFFRYSQYAVEIYAHGEKRTINTSDIKSIETSSHVKLILDSGETVIGMLLYNGQEAVINSEKFGIISSRKDTISSISSTMNENKIIAQLNSPKNVAAKTTNKTVGEDSESPPKEYLRGSTVIRKPGEVELALTLSYDRSRYDNPVISTMFGVVANETRNRFTADIATTVGITERLEAWLNVPFQYATFDRTEGIYQSKKDGGGIGDLSAGVRFLAIGEGIQTPSVTFSLDAIAPTGEAPYTSNQLDAAIASGRGNWAIRPGAHFVTTTDPLTFFYGTSYQYEFSATHEGTDYKRGDRIGYYGGVGFAVNDQASLSARLSGEHVFELKKAGVEQYGTSLDPVSIGLGLSYRTLSHLIINPFVNFGLNDDASDFVLGLSLARSF
ncbi:transporter [Desulfovibrio cuneatus]|uniref:transporter n=1 Tax=Desulfovibrio cuneatus TaxID=159728 RepID=UPI00146FA2A9|nr:transporter [Desulfovibrio cuneatus]